MTLRRRTAFALACCAGLACSLAVPADARPQDDGPIAGEALLPIERVTLYRSGVGSFERAGLIDGSRTVSLRFETDQINDILKSMVLLDLDGGRVAAVSYASQEPLERRLTSFAVDLSGNPTVTSLLRQLRGAPIALYTHDNVIDGTVVSTERRSTGKGEDGSPLSEEFVTMLADGGEIISIAMSEVRFFRLEDEELQQEFERALAALGEHRADRTKAVELRFEGEPGRGRRVVVAYVTEMPVWKTSYRLVLDESEGNPTIFGWAIVENTTDHDWENVRLALASGRPVSFTMDLYQPLFTPRPQVPVPVLSGVLPRLYESVGNSLMRTPSQEARRAERGGRYDNSAPGDIPALRALDALPEGLGGLMHDSSLSDMSAYMPGAQASAGFAGEQFFYTVDGPVTIERQRSAMLPILTSAIEGRRVSIYNPVINANSPMRGVELTNDTGLHLMPGPIAVYDEGSYTGDAQIPHTSRTQTRLLSYAVDLPVRCEVEQKEATQITRFRINNGILIQTSSSERTTTYKASSSDDRRGRTLLIEHPRRGGWELFTPQEPKEFLSNLYRFEVGLEASGSAELAIRERHVYYSNYELADFDIEGLRVFVRRGVASQAVLDAVRKAADLHAGAERAEERIKAINDELKTIARDQVRLRENIMTVRDGSDLAMRYLRRLTEQEDRIEALESERIERTDEMERLRDELRSFLRDLDIQ